MKEVTIKQGGVEWVNIITPTHETLKNLQEKYDFHELDIEDCLSGNQRPKIDEYEEYLFIILHFPVYNARKNAIELEEIDIFIGKNYLITLHRGKLKTLQALFQNAQENAKTRSEIMGDGSGYLLYSILNELFDECFPILTEIESNTKDVEGDVFDQETEQRDMLKDIMSIKKNIIIFKRIILPQRAVVAQLEHKNKKFLTRELEVYFDDIVDKIEKIWNTLENDEAVIESVQDTNESIISHNTNNVMKILTIFSVTMLPLTFITGLYGMNIKVLPFAESGYSFYILIGFMTTIVLCMFAYFKFKKWL